MKIPVVDSNDKIISYKERNKISINDIYRVSALWLRNEKGEFLLAKRTLSKKHDPGKWGPAVAGTVEKGESYYTNIKKEIYEELGIKITPKKNIKKERISKWHYFVQWYTAEVSSDTKFNINKTEIAEIRWFSKKKLYQEYDKNPEFFLSNIKENVECFE